MLVQLGGWWGGLGGPLLEASPEATGVDSAVHDEYRPAGQVAAVTNMVNGGATAGDVFDSMAGVTFDGVAGYNAGQAAIKLRNARANVKLHRVAGEAEIENSVKAGKLVKQVGKNGEAWVSEGMEHTKAYHDSRPFANKGIMEIEIPRDALNKIKADMIKQEGSRVVQKVRVSEGQAPANIFNREGLQNNPQGKVNIGIKGKANLQAFNDRIVVIRKISPDGPIQNPGVFHEINAIGAVRHSEDLDNERKPESKL